MTTFNIGIDWRRKGLICWDARPGDALNLLPRPLTYSTVEYRKTGVVSSAVLALLESPYGFWGFTAQTGTGVNNGLVLGQSDTPAVSYIPVSASSPYGVAVWVRGQAGYGSVSFILRVKDQAGTTLFTSSPFTLSGDWQQVSVTGLTDAASTHIYIEVIKNNHAANVTFQAAGFMLVAGSVIPTGYNAGIPVDPALVQPSISSGTPNKGYLEMKALIERNVDFDAVFGVTDRTAFGVLDALRESHILVPNDLALLSFDNISQSSHTTPPLTTVEVYKRELGTTAIDILHHQITASNQQNAVKILTPTRLIVRASA